MLILICVMSLFVTVSVESPFPIALTLILIVYEQCTGFI